MKGKKMKFIYIHTYLYLHLFYNALKVSVIHLTHAPCILVTQAHIPHSHKSSREASHWRQMLWLEVTFLAAAIVNIP